MSLTAHFSMGRVSLARMLAPEQSINFPTSSVVIRCAFMYRLIRSDKTGIKVQDRKLGLGVVRAVKGKMIQVYFERDGITKWIDSYFCIREKPSCVQTQSVEKPVSNKEGRKEPQLAARQEDSHPIKIGAKVMDNRLGVGTVREVNGSIIWVYFENYQITKLLDSRYCHFVDT